MNGSRQTKNVGDDNLVATGKPTTQDSKTEEKTEKEWRRGSKQGRLRWDDV